jgi:Hemerythrin HHE cation binding domain
MSLVATFQFNFFGRASFDMGYWIECFALDALAASASLFYALNGWQISQTLQSIGLVLASVANAVCLLHTTTSCVVQHGVFTPGAKWNPLSFVKLTHEAFRCNIATLRQHIDKVDVGDESAKAKENVGIFAAHLTTFFIVHEEHAKHEDLVVLKTFNDYFPKHARRYYEDHSQDTTMIREWRMLVNVIVDTKRAIADRKAAFDELSSGLPDFFTRFEKHIDDEDENLEPVSRKVLI